MIYLTLDKGTHKVKWTAPQGRHEVTYEKWKEAYPHIKLAEEAAQLLEDGENEKATMKAIESICRTIASLSDGITYEDLMKCKWDYVSNLFMTCFDWLSKEKAKTNFIIDGVKLDVPDYSKATAGQFMDVMALMEQVKEDSDIDKGLIIAAVYCRQTPYVDDEIDLNKRKEWLKQHAKADLFYSCAFFLRNFFQNCPIYSLHYSVAEVVERDSSCLVAWATSVYLQASRRAGFLSIRK
jgi:hypothetical protein